MKPCNLINAISIPLWLNDNYLLNTFQQDVLDKFSYCPLVLFRGVEFLGSPLPAFQLLAWSN